MSKQKNEAVGSSAYDGIPDCATCLPEKEVVSEAGYGAAGSGAAGAAGVRGPENRTSAAQPVEQDLWAERPSVRLSAWLSKMKTSSLPTTALP